MTAGGKPVFHGRRRGRRLRPGQQALLRSLLPRVEITPPRSGELRLETLFARPCRRYELEIGFGSGEHLAELAARHPEAGFIGCEAFVNGIVGLLRHVRERALDNVRIWPDDARLLMPVLPAAAFARIYLLFADPWPKARHAKRRFISPDRLDDLARIAAAGAELRVASDDRGYVRWTLVHATMHPTFRWTARRPGDWRRRPADWPETRYEQKALAAGRRPVYLSFRRMPTDGA